MVKLTLELGQIKNFYNILKNLQIQAYSFLNLNRNTKLSSDKIAGQNSEVKNSSYISYMG